MVRQAQQVRRVFKARQVQQALLALTVPQDRQVRKAFKASLVQQVHRAFKA
jgi:hypothetical protein